MLAAYASSFSTDDPTSGLEVGERPRPEVPAGWVEVQVRASALNHHDLWSLKGVGLAAEQLPMILGCDAAGVDPDGNEVIVHSVIGDPDAGAGDETLDPKRSLLSEKHQGTLAEYVVAPRRNLVAKPSELSFEEAACLPTAWLTAYKMLFSKAQVRPGETVLVQGAGGGVSTAAIMLARHAGLRVWATSRSESKLAKALEIGAHEAFESGARLPGRVDAVIESVGEATFGHSLRSTRPGGRIVVCGATTGTTVPVEMARVFFQQIDVLGSTMGNRTELQDLIGYLAASGLRPLIDAAIPLKDALAAFNRLADGEVFGKVVLTTA